MTNFQTILISIFLAFFVFAVLIFSGLLKIGGSSTSATALSGKIVIWGTFDNPDITKVFSDATDTPTTRELTVSYVKKDQATYQQALIEAFANGTGPDLFFLPSSMIVKNESFVYKIPYVSYPQKTFQDSFVDGADVFLASDGVIGFPVVVDPMVLYYNRDLLSNESIATVPTTWDQLFSLNSQLTKKKDNGTILQSMIALGNFDNVSHAKDIIATLLLQNGDSIMKRNTTGVESVFSVSTSGASISPAEAVMNFFTGFSTASDSSYSWNRALPKSIDQFTGGKLAFYLGRASELFKIQSVNPNLSFDVADILQTKGAPKKTFGEFYALSVNKNSKNLTTAFTVAGMLSSGDNAKNLANTLSLPPTLRSLLAVKPSDPYLYTFFNQAIISRAWLDPNTDASDGVFRELVENILSGKLSTTDAIGKASSQLGLIK
jgi:ABC-type glycerol-3-phosphate transport system substrate-binding protein